MELKEAVAREAVKLVRDGTVVGLGSGSTASIAIRLIGDRVREESLDITGVPTSTASERLGMESGIRIGTLDEHPEVDITIDGADEVDPRLDLVKGLGGALVREKMVAVATGLEVIVVDESKMVDHLCQKVPLPVEIVRFAHLATMRRLRALGSEPVLRLRNGEPFVSDNGNYIADCRFGKVEDAKTLEAELNLIPGVVDNGLFVGLADRVFVASEDGVRTLNRTTQ